MLVLTRRKNESLVIDDIMIIVVEIRGDKVRLGVEAPKQVPVHRRKVLDAVRGNEAGADSGLIRKTGAHQVPVQNQLYETFRSYLAQGNYSDAQSMLEQPHDFEPTEQERYKLSRGLEGIQ